MTNSSADANGRTGASAAQNLNVPAGVKRQSKARLFCPSCGQTVTARSTTQVACAKPKCNHAKFRIGEDE